MEFNIGCSGYYYPSWKDKFYPKEMKTRDWLSYYSSVFKTVELNGTFYKIPSLASLKKQALVTPDDFRFAVKINKAITHVKRLKETKQQIIEFQELCYAGLEKKISRFLFQMPPGFHYSEENLERILENIPASSENVIEFRHLSWWNSHVLETMEKFSLTFCNTDYPGLSLPVPLIHTSPVFYLRLHGSPELFKSAYDLNELEDIYNTLPKNCQSYNIYFNNTFYDAGYTNASQLIEIVNHHLDYA